LASSINDIPVASIDCMQLPIVFDVTVSKTIFTHFDDFDIVLWNSGSDGRPDPGMYDPFFTKVTASR